MNKTLQKIGGGLALYFKHVIVAYFSIAHLLPFNICTKASFFWQSGIFTMALLELSEYTFCRSGWRMSYGGHTENSHARFSCCSG